MPLILICGLLFRKLALPAKKPCLTWAVGQVRFAVALAAMGCSVVAADFSKGMLDRLHSKAAERGMLLERGTSGFGLDDFPAGDFETCPSEVQSGKILPLHMS